MKKSHVLILLAVLATFLVVGCGSAPPPKEQAPPPKEEPKPEPPKPIVRRPDVLDHKDYKWGKDVPDWVTMDVVDLEKKAEFGDYYVFKFESPRAQDLEGARIYTNNFTAAAQIAQVVQTRVQSKFAGAAVGDMDMLETYMENVVKSLSDATFSGYQPEADYWVQMRYYKDDGAVDEDAYTYVVLYTIEKDILDGLIADALEAANQEEAATQEEETARDRVREAFAEGF